MDPWQLVMQGQYDAAVRAYSEILREKPSSFAFYNRGTVYLNLGELSRAKADFEAAQQCSETRGDAYLQEVGVVEWLAGRHTEAAQIWRDLAQALDRREITYTDAAGGVENGLLLYFAAVRMGDRELLRESQSCLRKRTRTKACASWPGPLALFLLDRMDREQVFDRITSTPVLRERQQCQAELYSGVRSLARGETEEYARAMQRSAGLSQALLEKELYLARYESGLAR